MVIDSCISKRIFKNGYNTYEIIYTCEGYKLNIYNLGLHVGGPYEFDKDLDVDKLDLLYNLEEVKVGSSV